MKNYFLPLTLIALFSFLFVSCEKEEAPEAAFSADQTTITEGSSVQFIDESKNDPTSWNWNFGDGIISSEQSPSHIYYDAGIYTVELTVTNNNGSNTETKSNYITVEEAIPEPEASFSAIEGSSSEQSISIEFTDNSSNSPSDWLWTFEGGTPATSTEKNPTVTYTTSGTFDVTLEVTNDGGSNQVTMTDYINIVKFNNPTHTDIDITINSKDKTIPVDDYVLFASIDNTTVNIDAETHGASGPGDIIGLSITWEGSADLNEHSAWNLNVSSDFVFFYVTNSGTDNLTPFYVNYDTTDESEDNIIIANDGNPIPTGYYSANSGMEVRAYFESSPTTYVHWDEGNHFTLPWEVNQYKNLGNTNKTTKEPEKENVLDPNVGNIYQTGVK